MAGSVPIVLIFSLYSLKLFTDWSIFIRGGNGDVDHEIGDHQQQKKYGDKVAQKMRVLISLPSLSFTPTSWKCP